jgi:hypothetical protein
METLIARLKALVEFNCRAVLDDGHAITVEAIRTLVRSACRGVNLRTSVEVVNSRS